MTIVNKMWPVLADLTKFEQPAGDSARAASQTWQSTVVWLVAILLVVAMLLITFKKSKRTHLD